MNKITNYELSKYKQDSSKDEITMLDKPQFELTKSRKKLISNSEDESIIKVLSKIPEIFTEPFFEYQTIQKQHKIDMARISNIAIARKDIFLTIRHLSDNQQLTPELLNKLIELASNIPY